MLDRLPALGKLASCQRCNNALFDSHLFPWCICQKWYDSPNREPSEQHDVVCKLSLTTQPLHLLALSSVRGILCVHGLLNLLQDEARPCLICNLELGVDHSCMPEPTHLSASVESFLLDIEHDFSK